MIYVFLAKGFEEVEAVAAIDIMRRAQLPVKTVGVNAKTVEGAHGIKIECDCASNADPDVCALDGVVLPGGMPGTENLAASAFVDAMIDRAVKEGKLIAAICAAPLVPGRKGLLKGVKATCYPGFEKELAGAEITPDFVCKDGMFITAKGMGSAIVFGLEIVKHFKGESVAKNIGDTLQCP